MTLADVVSFVQAHQVLFTALGVDIINLIIGLVPGAQGNSILHQALLLVQGLIAPKPPQA